MELPDSLTAENGMKYLLIGAFAETASVSCIECGGTGDHENDDDAVCEECQGHGRVTINVPISWTTIKEIYKRIVEYHKEHPCRDEEKTEKTQTKTK